MKFAANPVPPSVEDIMMTAVHLAAIELAGAYPQSKNSIETWKGYLIQQAIKVQSSMTQKERKIYACETLCNLKAIASDSNASP